MIAFSPRLNWAVNFAAKHHDLQRRKGRDVPYIAHPVQVAMILLRYGRPEDEVVAAVLHDIVEDCVTPLDSAADLERKIAEKFGEGVHEIVMSVTEEKTDEQGRKNNHRTRRLLYLENLKFAPLGGWWVCAADKIHNGGTVLIDLMQAADREQVWGSFAGGKEGVCWWYRAVYERLRELGFAGAIMPELEHTAQMLESAAVTHAHVPPKHRPVYPQRRLMAVDALRGMRYAGELIADEAVPKGRVLVESELAMRYNPADARAVLPIKAPAPAAP